MGARTELRRRLDEALIGPPHEALIAVRVLIDDDLVWLQRHTVGRARRAGYTWAEIGRLLGRSRQATRERFSDLDDSWRAPASDNGDLATRINRSQRRRLELALYRERYRDDLERWEASGDDVVPW